MPMAIPAIAAAWASVSAAVATIGTALAFKAGIVAGLAAWGKVALVTTVLSTALMLKPPGLGSQGQQVNIQMAGPSAALPWIFGRTGTQGIITYRGTYGGSKNDILVVEHVLSVGPVAAIESFSVMGRALTYSGNPSTGLAEVTQVAGVDMRTSKLFRYGGLKVAHRTGSHTDTSTLSSITGEAIPGITSAHTMPGLARGILRCQLDEKRLNFPNGYPDDPIWVLRGSLCYDPRKDSTYSGGGVGSHRVSNAATHEWSENPFIVAMQFALGIRSPNGEVMIGLGLSPDMIDIPAFVAAANVADANGWKVGGQTITTDDEWPTMVNILASGGGVPIDRAGRLSCFVRSPKVATFHLAADEVLGSRRITTSTAMSQRFNRVVPSCRQENQKWEMIAGEPVSDPSWIAQDGGEVRTEEIAFPLVNNFRQAHQLAAYYACDSREFIETELTAKPRALNADVGECISVDLPEFAPGQTFIVMGRKWNPEQKTVTLNLKAETFAKHAFCLGQSQVAPAPPTLNKFDPNRPAAPAVGDWAVVDNKIVQTRIETVEGVEITREQAIVPALVISGQVRDPNVQKVIVEYREPLAEDVIIPADVDAIDFGWTSGAEGSRTATDFEITGLKPNTAFEVSVSYETLTGAFSNRLVLGTTTTAQDQAGGLGPGTVDWEKPDGEGPIINRPPAFTDLADGGKIKADFIAVEAEVTKTLTEVLADAATRVDDAWTILGADDLSGLRHKVAVLEASGPDGELVGRVAGLEIKIDGNGSTPGALARLLTVEQAQVTLTNGLATKADTTALTALQTALTNADTALDARLTTMGNTVVDLVNNSAKASDLTALGVTVTSQGNAITATNTKLNTVEATANNAAGTASSAASSVGSLQTTVNGFDSRITTAQSVAANALGQVEAKAGLILNAGGKITGYNISATQNSSTFDVLADKFRVTDGTSTNTVFTYVGGVLTAGSIRLTGSININNRFIVDANGDVTQQSATSGARKVETNQLITIYDANRMRVRLGVW